MLRVLLPQGFQQRRGADNIARCPQLDDQNAALALREMGTILAVRPVDFVGTAGHMATKMKALGLELQGFNFLDYGPG